MRQLAMHWLVGLVGMAVGARAQEPSGLDAPAVEPKLDVNRHFHGYVLPPREKASLEATLCLVLRIVELVGGPHPTPTSPERCRHRPPAGPAG